MNQSIEAMLPRGKMARSSWNHLNLNHNHHNHHHHNHNHHNHNHNHYHYHQMIAIIVALLLFAPFTTAVPMNAADKANLELFHDGISNQQVLGWDFDESQCESYKGISCNPNGRIIHIDLTALGLEGTISPSLGSLTLLQSILLSNNLLHGSLPSTLGQLNTLTVLTLHTNALTGTIPSAYGTAPILITLDLHGNQLAGSIPTQIASSKILLLLNLSGNYLTGEIPSQFGTGLLQYLYLSRNNLHGSIPSELGSMKDLRGMQLDFNELSGTIPTELGRLTLLTNFVLFYNSLEGTLPTELGKLSALNDLRVDINSLEGTIPTELGALKTLGTLGLAGNFFTGSIPTHLSEISNLSQLFLNANFLEGSFPVYLSKLTSLRELVLNNNKFQGALPSEIGQFSFLTRLILTSNLFSSSLPTQIGQLVSLNDLYLDDNNFDGSLPTELSSLRNLTKMSLVDNYFEGPIPTEFAAFSTLKQMLLSSNYFDCNTSDFSMYASVTDTVFWQAQCEFSCPPLDEFGAEWERTQAFHVHGTCNPDFKGSPSRECLREGVVRYWSPDVENPCVGLKPMEQLRSQPLLFTVPFASFVLFLLLSVIFFLVNWSRKDGVIYLMQWALSLATLVFDIWFLVVISSGSSTLFSIGTFFMCWWFLSNFGYVLFCAHVFSQENVEWAISSKIPLIPVALISVVDVLAYRLLSSKLMAISGFLEGSKKDLRELVESLGLISAIHRDIPFFILQLVSIFYLGYSPIVLIMGMVFSCLSFVNVLSQEIFRWLKHAGISKKIDPKIFSFDEEGVSTRSRASSMRYSELNDVSNSVDEEETPYFWRAMLLITMPFVIVFFLPQFLTLLGIPFTLGCLQRFRVALKSRQMTPLLGEYYESEFSWFGRRGFFLLSLNAVSFFLVLFITLPFLTAIGIVLGILRLLTARSKYTSFVEWFIEYRRSLHWLVGHLLWCYFPSLDTSPTMRSLPQDFLGPSWTKKILGLVWYVFFDVILPWLNTALDFVFAVRLLHLYRDPYLELRDLLFPWVIVAFLAATNGVLLEATKVFLEITEFGWGFSKEKVYHHAISRSPFGNPVNHPWSHNIIKILSVFLQETLQLMAVSNTVNYMGGGNPMWLAKLTFSAVTLALNLSKFLTNFVFGRQIVKRADFGLRTFYFVLVSFFLFVSLSSLVGDDRFCDLDRSVTTRDILTQACHCRTLTANLNIANFTSDISADMQVLTLQSKIVLINNRESAEVIFYWASSFNSTVAILENTGAVNVQFPLAQVMEGGSQLLAFNNSQLESVSFPVLTNITEGSLIDFEYNQAKELRLRSLFTLSGELLIANNHITQLDFASLNLINTSGGIVIFANEGLQGLTFPTLGMLQGILGIIANSALESLEFTALEFNGGLLYILENPQLKVVSFPSAVSNFRGTISNNPSLTTIDLSSLQVADGITRIAHNDALTDIKVPEWYASTSTSDILIGWNPALVTLNLTTLDCRFTFVLTLENNPNLESVYVAADKRCPDVIRSIDNPKMQYILV